MSRDGSPASPAPLRVELGERSYDIHLGRGLLDAAGEILARSSVCRASWS
jgi:hypothetical protein